jgi:hypothetical protein
MSEPIVFISHHRIKPGKAEELKGLTAEIWSAMETEKPQTLMNLPFMNQEGTEVTFMHGSAGEQIVEGMRAEAAGGGATLTLWPEFVTRFLRLAPG